MTEAKYRQAAWVYFGYGAVYWLTALYLQLLVFEVRAGSRGWFALGALITVGVPWLLVRRRPWFERWVLSRRDFARLLALLVLVRAAVVARLALTGAESTRMPRLGGGVPTSSAGAWAMALIALVTGAMLARAAWSSEASPK
jgi:hypothetical protein